MFRASCPADRGGPFQGPRLLHAPGRRSHRRRIGRSDEPGGFRRQRRLHHARQRELPRLQQRLGQGHGDRREPGSQRSCHQLLRRLNPGGVPGSQNKVLLWSRYLGRGRRGRRDGVRQRLLPADRLPQCRPRGDAAETGCRDIDGAFDRCREQRAHRV